MNKVGVLEIPKREDGIVDLESQFILRLPLEASKALREAIDNGDPILKDRMSIKLENDVRYGEVRFDHWMFFAKVVDLPTIIESLKTIDKKNFYKTADICQMMICKEEDDRESSDEEEREAKMKNKKDINKVEKKFLWPHGITPPMKNVRKRRFRKTLKKKYVEAPEIEKEVKRLLRGDTEAVHVKWDLVMEDVDDKSNNKTTPHNMKEEPLAHGVAHNTHTIKSDLAEHDIFGGAVSDSEEEGDNMVNIMDLDEDNSRLSRFSGEMDSRLSDSATFQQDSQSGTDGASMVGGRGTSSQFITQFNREMFIGEGEGTSGVGGSGFETQNVKSELYGGDTLLSSGQYYEDNADQDHLSTETIQARMDALDQEISELENKRRQQEQELANIENQTLRQRFQSVLDNLNVELMEKDQEYQKLATMLDTPPDC
uniref:Transcription initiation factor TFIID subunit 7 n=1 Tax=Cacopsylla melanoneura TaxID=428564 RepID=A0A8D8RSQ9_9HEMI